MIFADRDDIIAAFARIGSARVSLRSIFALQLAFPSKCGDESEFIAYIMDVRSIIYENELIIN